jgi:hypothetical protein
VRWQAQRDTAFASNAEKIIGRLFALPQQGGVALRFPPHYKEAAAPNCSMPRIAAILLLALAVAAQAETVRRPAKVLSPPIRPWQKLNPLWSLGNADDPQPPVDYKPGSPIRRLQWSLRNPLHNFTFYVIGVSDKDTVRTGRHANHVFAPGGGWNWAVTRRHLVLLPFVSYENDRCRFYLGWRESGNFGAKLTFRHRPTAQPAPRGLAK